MGSRRDANMPSQRLYKTAAKPSDYKQFEGELGRLPQQAAHYWSILLGQDPMVRLKINMLHIVDHLMLKPITTVIPDGVDAHELCMLEALNKLSSNCQVVGHELMNLRERQYFVDEFRVIFNEYRCKGGASNGQAKEEESHRDA